MDDSTQYIDHYVQQLRHGDKEHAWFSLVEMEPSAAPELIKAYYSETDPRVRVLLIGIIAEYPQTLTLEFLAKCLEEVDPETWKTALDGIAAIGNRLGQNASIEILAATKELLKNNPIAEDERVVWIDEAIQQLLDESVDE